MNESVIIAGIKERSEVVIMKQAFGVMTLSNPCYNSVMNKSYMHVTNSLMGAIVYRISVVKNAYKSDVYKRQV